MSRRTFDEYDEVFEDLMSYKEIDTKNIKDRQSLENELHKLRWGKKKLQRYLIDIFVGEGFTKYAEPIPAYQKLIEANTEKEEEAVVPFRPTARPLEEKVLRMEKKGIYSTTPYYIEGQKQNIILAGKTKTGKSYYYYPKGSKNTEGKSIGGRRIKSADIIEKE